jgi:hypothetical protein
VAEQYVQVPVSLIEDTIRQADFDWNRDTEASHTHATWVSFVAARVAALLSQPSPSVEPVSIEDPNRGEGWFEWVTSPGAETRIAYVYESGGVYLPEPGATPEHFLLAAAAGKARRLVYAADVTPPPSRPEGSADAG